MGGVVGHALKIGVEYMDKIKKGSANCRGFYCPSYREPDHKLKSLFYRGVFISKREPIYLMPIKYQP